jgi:hypothetical protein
MTKLSRLLLRSLGFGLLGLNSLHGAEYFVSPSGNDKHPGTLEKPFQSIQYAVKKLNPGDTLNIDRACIRNRDPEQIGDRQEAHHDPGLRA